MSVDKLKRYTKITNSRSRVICEKYKQMKREDYYNTCLTADGRGWVTVQSRIGGNAAAAAAAVVVVGIVVETVVVVEAVVASVVV